MKNVNIFVTKITSNFYEEDLINIEMDFPIKRIKKINIYQEKNVMNQELYLHTINLNVILF